MPGGNYLFDNGDKTTANKGPHIQCENHLEFALYDISVLTGKLQTTWKTFCKNQATWKKKWG